GILMRNLLAFAVPISALTLTVAVNAASPSDGAGANGATTEAPAVATPAPSTVEVSDRVNLVPASGPRIKLDAGKGTLIRLPREATTVFIANPDVADVQIKTPLLIYLIAKA